jgi:Holliday junction DNA helicase RuvB
MRRKRHDDGDEDAAPEGASPRAAELEEEESPDDRAIASSLRPRRFDEYIGQVELIGKLRIYVEAAAQRGEALDHVLLHGPPGLGKTTLAQIVANEVGVRLHISSGPAIEHKGVLAGLLTGLGERDVLFIDEIHRLSPTVEESLYSAMEDRRIDLPIGEGSKARTVSFSLPPFTLIGATTRTALLSAPLRDRFHIVEALDFYGDEDLARIVLRGAEHLALPIDEDAARELGRRSRGTPRVAIRLTKRVRDFVQVSGRKRLSLADATSFLDQMGVDEEGLDEVDQKVLDTVITKFDGGPVGIEAIAASIGVRRDTLEAVHEPFLLQRGFLLRTPRGRVSTAKAAQHLGLADPRAAARDAMPEVGQGRLFEE